MVEEWSGNKCGEPAAGIQTELVFGLFTGQTSDSVCFDNIRSLYRAGCISLHTF